MKVLPLAGLPTFVLGASVIRGEAVPVVDLARLFGGDQADVTIGRFVVLRVEERRAALAVERVVGITDLRGMRLTAVPEMLKIVRPESLAALGSADRELLLVLGNARVVPDEAWAELARVHVRLD